MHRFDTVLKEILLASATSLPSRIAGSNVAEWLNVEMPEIKAGRLDLVAWLANGTLLHGELQARNDPEMLLRMLDAVPYLRRQFRSEALLESPLWGDHLLALLAPGSTRAAGPICWLN